MSIISWYTLVGLFAQAAFASRMLVQWVLSERAKRVVNPALFWWLSLAGSLSMSFYGYLREDLAILLGQLVSFYIYVYNLKLKNELFKATTLGVFCIVLAPIVLLALELREFEDFMVSFLNEENIPYTLLCFGLGGQLLFSFRFVYQMIVSHRCHDSVLPPMFWYISLLAAVMVQIYGLFRLDIVLIIGQVGGLVTYIRNIMLHSKSKNLELNKQAEAEA